MATWSDIKQLEKEFGDLLIERDGDSSDVDFTRWADAPVEFMREVLRFKPWSAQLRVAEAVRDHPLVVVRGCNSAGKDAVAAQVALWWVYAVGGMVLISSASAKQLRDASMVEVSRAFGRARMPYSLPGELFQMALRVGGEPRILAFTSTDSSRMTGFHHGRVLVILSEAQGIEDFAWEGLMSCATGAHDRILAIGNPLIPSGRFYTASVGRNSPWHPIRISAEEHPNVIEGREVIPGGPTREWADRMSREWGGKESNMYRARVLGEFPDQGEEALIARSWVDAAVARFQDMKEVPEGEPIVAVDVAQYGVDKTVLGVRRGNVLQRFEAWGNTPLTETTRRVAEEARREGVTSGIAEERWGRIVVDSLGVGAMVADQLREWGFRVTYFNAGLRDVPDRFLNVRAEAHWELRTRLEEGRIAFPKDTLLVDELIAVRWKPTADNKVQIEAKDDLKGRIGRSPDRADCLMMAFYSKGWREIQLFEHRV